MFKKVSALCSAAVIALTMNISAFANTSSKSKSSTISGSQSLESALDKNTSSSTTSSDSDSSSEADEKINSMITQYVEGSVPDYANDSHYDTKGNASIVKEKKIIHDSAQMQFISVTTKSGAVFYILIDYTAIKQGNVEDSVYFLNKVDDYDLYQLINSDDTENNTPQAYEAQKNDNDNNSIDDTDNANTNSTVSDKSTATTTKENPFKSSIIMLVAFGVISVGAVLVILSLKKKKKGSSSISDDDDDLDFNDSDE